MSFHENKLSICFLLLFYLFYGTQSKGSIWYAVCMCVHAVVCYGDVKVKPK